MSSIHPREGDLRLLARFRGFALVTTATALGLSFISRLWFPSRVAVLFAIVAAYFLTLALRTHVMCSQISSGRPLLFDRPAPEWITVSFALLFLVVAFWPS